jgi:hypothetical protein
MVVAVAEVDVRLFSDYLRIPYVLASRTTGGRHRVLPCCYNDTSPLRSALFWAITCQ